MWRVTLVASLLGSVLFLSPAISAARSRRNRASTPAAAEAAAPAIDAGASAGGQRDPALGSQVGRDPQILNKTEMLSLVKKYATDIADALLDGEYQREAAVRSKDAIKLSCIQDRLSNMKAMKKLSDDRLEATERPVIRADELNLRHEFRGVEMAHERVIELHKELLECVGDSLELSVSGGASPETPGALGTTDPAGTNVETPKIDRPPTASTYQ